MAVDIEKLKEKIAGAVQGVVDANVRIEDTPVGNVHVFIESKDFEGLSERERDRLLLPALEMNLTADEFIRISILILSTPGQFEDAVGA